MQLVIIKDNKLKSFFLPGKIFGNYWITDNNNVNLVNVEASNNRWVLRSNNEVKIINKGIALDSVYLIEDSFCTLKKIKEDKTFIIYCTATYDQKYNYLKLKNEKEITIGRSKSNDIVYDNINVGNNHCKISYIKNSWQITNGDSKFTFVNDHLANDGNLFSGDIVFIVGLKIIIGTNFIVINNPNGKVTYNESTFQRFEFAKPEILEYLEDDADQEIQLYKPEQYFLRKPRFKATIEQAEIQIDAPPPKQDAQEMPLIYTIGPMITMAMTSMVTMVSSLSNIMANGKSWQAMIPSIVISIAMLCSVLVWPSLTRNYSKKQKIKKENLRTTKYKAYLEEKKRAINDTIVKQRQIIIDNNFSLQECMNIIDAQKRNLWERELDDDDFLTVRIGVGAENPDLVVKAPEQHFSLEDDELNLLVQSIVSESKVMDKVPIRLSLSEKNIIAFVGQPEINCAFIDGVILQLVTFHSYDQLKIVIFTNQVNAHNWEYLKIMPHCWDNAKSVRFFASNQDEMKQISNYLEKIFNDRSESTENHAKELDYHSFQPYYLIITDDLKIARNIEIIKKILASKVNKGFTFIIKNKRLSNLPNECSTFLNIDQNGSGLFESELVSTKQKSFVADLSYNLDMLKVAKTLANIPLEIRGVEANLPDTVSFLQMYNIGKVEQLNTQSRWKTSNPTLSLNVPVGLDENGELFYLDLHEKAYGPHGLIAGMTGSGKSEFIITYVLSLAVNFHPYEVQFILIDYKGGGLAGAFENRETGIKLPHLAGTITNLDTMEMNRSLASIQSELRRRQKMFNEARDLLNESSIDIYKYQRFYRDGLVKQPISHLFIISDEFAELKAQQPDFMSQLIQTARIGRSLGVHLILATQKPSGVVDDQIWSNSKFRICLKVQDKSDSMDMIKRPDAAMIKHVGRFYLQVGYNEFFGLGQSAWCGAQYYPSAKVKKKVDNSIGFINSIGQVIRSVDEAKKLPNLVSKGEELPNIVKYLVNLAKAENISIPQLWLEKISQYIYVENLKQKYNYQVEPYILNPIVGEFDDPENQRQGLLTVPLSKDGNTIIYGVAGSGKELALTTLIYSLITDHSPAELNLYLLDFGAETLKNFQNAPQVGDVLFQTDVDKITNLMKMLQVKIEERKRLFVDYNGEYDFYVRNSGHSLARIVVIINNYEVFSETYENQEEFVQILSREGLKYGIIFIITCSGSNSVKYRLRQNFKSELVLQMNDEGDYISIFGSTGKVYPSNIKGRGIVKLDKVYEFQTAYAYKESDLGEYIKLVCRKLAEKYETKAIPIPILPAKVTINHIKEFIKSLTMVPIGIRKDNLKISTIDLNRSYITIISGAEVESFKLFVSSLITTITYLKQIKLVVLDVLDLLSPKIPTTVEYTNSNFVPIMSKITAYIDENYKLYLQNNYNKKCLDGKERVVVLIYALDELLKRIPGPTKNEFLKALEKGNDLELVNFIIIDNVVNIKKQEYETWYKTSVSNNHGIWLGNGITEQFLFKLVKTPRELRELIPIGFGYNIRNGIASLVKLVEGVENDE